MMWPCHRFSTHPAPVIIALSTVHVHATIVFLNRDLALRTSVCTYLVSPTAVHCLLSFLAVLPLVKRKYMALKTETLLALLANDLLDLMISYLYNCVLTLWIRTEFSCFTSNDLSILFKLPILWQDSIIYKWFKLLFSDLSSTSSLRALKLIRFSSLRNLVWIVSI